MFNGSKSDIKKEVQALLSEVKTDLHSHLLPGLDDGVTTYEESFDCISGLIELGFKKLIITPHVISDGYNNSKEIIIESLIGLQKYLEKKKLDVDLQASAEYYLDEEFVKKVRKDDLLPIGKQKYILFEMPYYSTFDNLYEVIFALHTGGYTPVLAHPERYFYYHQNFKEYKDLKRKGVLFQMNIVSLIGSYSPGAKKVAENLISENMVDFVGSDTHSMSYVDTIKQLLTNKHLIKLINSGNLLNSTL